MDIDAPNTVNFSYTKVKCSNCGKGFKTNLGYGLHKLNCRKDDAGSSLANVMKPSFIRENVELIVKNIVSDMVNRVEENVYNETLSAVIEKGKGNVMPVAENC